MNSQTDYNMNISEIGKPKPVFLQKSKFTVKTKYFKNIINLNQILDFDKDENEKVLMLPKGITKEFFRKFLEFTLNTDSEKAQCELLNQLIQYDQSQTRV